MEHDEALRPEPRSQGRPHQVALAGDPAAPRVLIRPAGAEAAYVVDNPVWPSRIGDKTEA